jgi:ribosomal protein S18 acetylase RimI-like enzyme
MTTYDERRSLLVQMNVSLRVATPADLPKLEWYGQFTHFRNLFRRTFREQQAGRRLMLVVDLNNFPIGHVFIHFKTANQDGLPHRAYLYSFRVMEMFRGQGIGTWLLHEAEAVILDRGIHWAIIAVAKDNLGAQRLYQRHGYTVYGEDDGEWNYVDHRGVTQHVHEPCWLLEKHLSNV